MSSSSPRTQQRGGDGGEEYLDKGYNNRTEQERNHNDINNYEKGSSNNSFLNGNQRYSSRSRSRSPRRRRDGNRPGRHHSGGSVNVPSRRYNRSHSRSRSRSPPHYYRSRSRSLPRDSRRGGRGEREWDGYRDRGSFDGDRGRPHFGHSDDYASRMDHRSPRTPNSYDLHHGPPGSNSDRPSSRQPPPKNNRREEIPGVSLLVRNIGPDITPSDLQVAFGRIGQVRDVYIPRDFHSQQPKGFAFVEFASPNQARDAQAEMDRFLLRGRELEVVFAQEKRKTPNEMRGRTVSGDSSANLSSGGGGGGRTRDRSSSFDRYRRKGR